MLQANNIELCIVYTIYSGNNIITSFIHYLLAGHIKPDIHLKCGIICSIGILLTASFNEVFSGQMIFKTKS